MRKISKQNFKSFFMWVIIFALTLIISMSGAYAYFTATAEKKQSSLTTGIIKVGFVADSTKIVETGSSTQVATKIVPGSSVTYQGLVQNTGTADMYAVLECHVTVDGNTVQTQYYTATGTKLTYEDAQNAFTTGATPIAVNATSQFKIEFVFDTGYDNSYKNKSATLQVVARAIQQSHLTAVQATNQLLSGYIPADALPAAYTRVEYIETAGEAYLDTGVYPAEVQNLGLDMKYDSLAYGKWMFGSRSSYGSADTYGIYISSSNEYGLQIGGATGSNRFAISKPTTGLHTLKIMQSKVYFDGTDAKVSITATTTASTKKYPMWLGTINQANTADSGQNRNFIGKIYYFTLYSGTDLVRKMIPCKNSAGVAGMYDMSTKTFYASKTSTAFTAGPTV